MAFLNKDKLIDGFEKVIDTANGAADKAEQFVKDKEIDKKVGAAVDKTQNFVKDMEIDKKIDTVKGKAEDFIKSNEIDKAVTNAKFTIEEGVRKAGETIEKGLDKIR